MARKRSKNELKILEGVQLPTYYNDFVLPLKSTLQRNFTPMSEARNTGLCPFHKDTDPSFHWWKSKNIFHCFGCGVGGDVIRIHQMLLRSHYSMSVSNERVVEILAEKYGIELDPETGFEVESPFDRARQVLLQPDYYKIPSGTFSLTEFRQLNNRVKTSNLALKAKIANFEHLDTVASVHLSNQRGGN